MHVIQQLQVTVMLPETQYNRILTISHPRMFPQMAEPDFPALMASGMRAMTENIRSSPTAVRTLPSITPVGG